MKKYVHLDHFYIKRIYIASKLVVLSLLISFIEPASALPFPLPSGYFVPAKQSMLSVYPRPDTETNLWARHRWAYYDGTHNIEYRIPIGISFGAFPFKFTCLVCPSGMTVGSYYGDANYAIVTWTPTGPATNQAVTIRVQDQANTAPLDISWTVSTSSSTSHFIFTDSVNGNDTSGSGAITAPYKTAAKSISPTNATKINYFRGGTYAINNILGATVSPMALINYPGSAVTFSMTSGNLGSSGNLSDTFIQGITFKGGQSSVDNYKTIFLDGSYNRQTFHALSFVNTVNGPINNDNPTSIFFNSVTPARRYIYIADSTESGRAAGTGNNSGGLAIIFTTADSLFERNSVTNTNAALGNIVFKSSTYNSALRGNYIQAVTQSQEAFGSLDQIDNALPSGNNEISYNTIKSPTAPSNNDNAAALTINYRRQTATAPGKYWVYRNTVYGGLCVRDSRLTNGPFSFEKNVVVVNTLNSTPPTGLSGVWAYQTWDFWPNASISDTGTECEGTTASGFINTTTMKLAGPCATNWLGRRGAQITYP